jgi:FAD synthase
VRAALAAGDLALATRLLGRPHAVAGIAANAPQGSVLLFELPVALPPDGAWDVELEFGHATSPGVVRIDSGTVELPRVAAGTRVRVAFLARH